MSKAWIWSEHIEKRMLKRKLSRELVEIVINNPDEIVQAGQERLIYQKVIGDKLCRVVTERNTLVTVYLTSKIKKYLKGDQKP